MTIDLYHCSMFEKKYGILVATRNRVEELHNLILSITHLEHKPAHLVISYSGEDPCKSISSFQELLNIELVKNTVAGQVLQKKKGLLRFGNTVDWIMFCDDDITLEQDSISKMFDLISKHDNHDKIGGAGFSLGQTIEQNHHPLEKLGRSIFQLNEYPSGVVKSNGYNTNYIRENSVIYTTWLNGASIWRREIAKGYEVQLDEVPHALSEDLIFSYAVSRKHLLIYNPFAVIHLQKQHKEIFEESQLRYEHLYHNLYFVLLNKELSKFGYLWSSFGRMIKLVCIDQKNNLSKYTDVYNFFDVFKLVFTNKSAAYVLEKRIKKSR